MHSTAIASSCIENQRSSESEHLQPLVIPAHTRLSVIGGPRDPCSADWWGPSNGTPTDQLMAPCPVDNGQLSKNSL